jgi:hypothetical protein
MRLFAFSLLLSLAASGGALAYCPLYPAETPGGKVAAQADRAVCQQQELSARTALKSQELHFQGELNDLQRNIEQEQRMQDMFLQQQLMFNSPVFHPFP